MKVCKWCGGIEFHAKSKKCVNACENYRHQIVESNRKRMEDDRRERMKNVRYEDMGFFSGTHKQTVKPTLRVVGRA